MCSYNLRAACRVVILEKGHTLRQLDIVPYSHAVQSLVVEWAPASALLIKQRGRCTVTVVVNLLHLVIADRHGLQMVGTLYLLDLPPAAVLVLFLHNQLDFSEDSATALYHASIMLCYLLPLFGAIISDSCLGKYW